MSEQSLYIFCMENIYNLINGSLSTYKIEKLREIDFDFNYYIDEYLKIINKEKENVNAN
mgnify:CR=1 FL=1